MARRPGSACCERVKELDYQPNSLARSLVTGRSYLIGLVAPSLLHPFFAEIARALSNEIRDKGYSLIVSSSEEDPELEREEISRLLGRRLDALVIASAGSNVEQFERMDSKAQPYVLIDRDLTGLVANFVGVNDEKVGRLATEHLIDMGCRRVAHIRGQDNSTGIGRIEGYRQALRHRGVPYSEDYVVRSQSHGYRNHPSGRGGHAPSAGPRPEARRGILLQRSARDRSDEHHPRIRPENSGRHCSHRLR